MIVKRGRPVNNGTFWYIDSVEEAMCFGWIDSTTKKMDNGVTAQRLAPRRKGHLWSELNKEHCRRMERLGLMTDAGRAILPDMSPKGFVIDKDIEKSLNRNFLNLGIIELRNYIRISYGSFLYAGTNRISPFS